MCESMADIQSPTAEIRRGKKKRKEEEQTTGWKCTWPALLHRAVIKSPARGLTVIAASMHASLIVWSLKAPWPWPWHWIESRSHQHAQYLWYYQHAKTSECSVTQYRNMAIWISWNIDIPGSLNFCDSFPTRTFENRAPASCRPSPTLSISTISFELHAKVPSGGGDRATVMGNSRKFKCSMTLTLTLDRVKVISIYTLHVGLSACPIMWL